VGVRVHVCKTYSGEVAKALVELVRLGLASSYASAVAQAVLEYHRRVIREDMELSRLRAISRAEADSDPENG